MSEVDQLLTPLRNEIDSLDEQIVKLLNQRASVASKIGELKGRANSVYFRPEREEEVLQKVSRCSQGPIRPESLRFIYREIMSACRGLEREITVAFLGPKGTFSEMAMGKAFGSSVTGLACDRIDEVFRCVEAGSAQYGIVPIENSTEGSVNRTMDCLFRTSLSIIGECSVAIHHNLLAVNPSLQGVDKVYSHPQSLAQCIGWLNSHMPNLERIPVSSNAEAARMASLDPTATAIAGKRAAHTYGLNIVAANIEDDSSNRTRFVVLGAQNTTPSKGDSRDKTSLIFSVPHKAGALFQALRPLDEHHVSMTRFESRPARSGAWEYYFYTDIEGHSADPAIAKALEDFRQGCSFYKNLGSYPIESVFGIKNNSGAKL